jgi:hypothetical protein
VIDIVFLSFFKRDFLVLVNPKENFVSEYKKRIQLIDFAWEIHGFSLWYCFVNESENR